jgi:hypothetical protein
MFGMIYRRRRHDSRSPHLTALVSEESCEGSHRIEAAATVRPGKARLDQLDNEIVGNQFALVYDFFCAIPNGVAAFTAARSMSPVEICGMAIFAAMNAACLPLPAPGALRV